MQQDFVDATTGFRPTTSFLMAAKNMLANLPQNASVSLLLFDIDHLQRRHGSISWEVAKLADFMDSCLPNDAIAGRVGPDEIAVVVHGDEVVAKQLAEEVRTRVAIEFSKYDAKTTISVGIRTGSAATTRTESLMKDASRCLIAAKACGRNCSVTWSELEDQALDLQLPLSVLHMENETRVTLERIADNIVCKVRRLYREYGEKAERDPLTGLNNRGSFDARLTREFESARKYNQPLTIGIIDADHFGKFNKHYTLTVGDAALRVLADVLRQTIRDADWVARYGGEEFCVVMPNTTAEEGCQVLERIRVMVADRGIPTNEGDMVRITVSGGVAELKESDQDVKHFVSRASKQTNIAKSQGRNRIACECG